MWTALALEHRAWDLLEPVLAAKDGEQGEHHLGRLYDLWVSTRYNVGEMRRLQADVDLEPLVKPWHTAHSRGVSAGYGEQILVHVRWLIPAGEPLPTEPSHHGMVHRAARCISRQAEHPAAGALSLVPILRARHPRSRPLPRQPE